MSDEQKNAGGQPAEPKGDDKPAEGEGKVNPSAPEDANTTPGSTGTK